MKSWAASVVGALVLASCGGAGATTSPASSQTTRSAASLAPTPTAEWVTFTSDRYGYSIDHPADWQVREQPGKVILDGMKIGYPGTDTIAPRDNFRYGSDDGDVVVSAHELDGAESLVDFTDRFSRAAACGDLGFSVKDIELGGEPAQSRMFTCGDYVWMQVTAIRNGLGYVIWFSTTISPWPDKRPINVELLATFRFTD